MPALFRYRAIEAATGRLRTGEQTGDSAYAVRANLRRVGLDVSDLAEVRPRTAPRWLAPLTDAWHARRRRQRRLARADLCDAIATLAQAGVPLEQALGSLAGASTRPATERRLLRGLRDRLREGCSLSEACTEAPDWFDRFDVALIAAGQHAGELPATLIGLARHHQRAGSIGQRLFVALAYPVIVLAAGLGVVVFMSAKPLPQLIALIEQARHQPPALTTALLAFGQWLAVWWWTLPLVGIAVGTAMSALATRVPIVSRLGRILHGNPIARARTRVRVASLAMALARLRRAGMPLTDALAIVAETVPERALRRLLTDAVAAIRRGEDFSTVVAASPLLDPEFSQLLQLGEKSGELTEMLERIAERYQRAADRSAERVAAILAPAAIVILAFVVGVIVIACALPLMELGDLV